MLKWTVQNQRRSTQSDCNTCNTPVTDNNIETSSNASSDSSEASYGLSVPIRYHERRASRPKSLAIIPQDTDFDKLETLSVKMPANQKTALSPRYSSCSRVNRHSMYIVSSEDGLDKKYKSHTIDGMNIHRRTPTKLSAYQPTIELGCLTPDVESDAGILKISTTSRLDKTKSSRNSFWKSLRLKAQGKNKDMKLAKAHSISNLPVAQKLSTTNSPVSTPVEPTLPVATPSIAHDISPSCKSKSNIQRHRSLKLIKKENENKRPKTFRKSVDLTSEEVISSSPDSGVSSMRLHSTDSDNPGSPSSPITPIDLAPTDVTELKQQFTEAVLQYLNERLEKKGYSSTISVTSSTRSSKSDDGSSDVFCYDTDTVLRRPNHNNNNNNTRPTIKATF